MIEPHLPERFKGGLERYFESAIIPGSFLWAVLRGKLVEAFMYADDDAVHELPGLVSWLYNYAPRGHWGSEYNCGEHIKLVRELRNQEARNGASA